MLSILYFSISESFLWSWNIWHNFYYQLMSECFLPRWNIWHLFSIIQYLSLFHWGSISDSCSVLLNILVLFVPSLIFETGSVLLNPFPNKFLFLRVYSSSLLKTPWEKEKLLTMSDFSFSYGVFYPLGQLSAIFINLKIVGCKLFQFGRV